MLCQDPDFNWLKLHTNVMANGCLGQAGGWGFFQNCCSFVKGCFMILLGFVMAFEAEFCMAMKVFEYARQFGRHHVWLECDSIYVVNLD